MKLLTSLVKILKWSPRRIFYKEERYVSVQTDFSKQVEKMPLLFEVIFVCIYYGISWPIYLSVAIPIWAMLNIFVPQSILDKA